MARRWRRTNSFGQLIFGRGTRRSITRTLFGSYGCVSIVATTTTTSTAVRCYYPRIYSIKEEEGEINNMKGFLFLLLKIKVRIEMEIMIELVVPVMLRWRGGRADLGKGGGLLFPRNVAAFAGIGESSLLLL